MVRVQTGEADMASIANLILDAFAGGVFGLIGTALGRVVGILRMSSRFAQE